MPKLHRSAKDALLEQLADKEHDSWARWMRSLFSKCQPNADGSMTIPTNLVVRWHRQMRTPYADLSEQEKESDREEVRLILPLIEAAYQGTEEELIASYTHEGAVRLIGGRGER